MGFASPWVVFLGTLARAERDFVREVLHTLGPDRYPRLVEPAAGSFAISLTALDLGWKPADCDTSDVTLYSSVLGALLNGEPLDTLGVAVDGQPFDHGDGPPHHQAAEILFEQLILRTDHRIAKSTVTNRYLAEMVHDFHARRAEHVEHMADRVLSVVDRLHGARYRAMDLTDHTVEVLDDPGAIVVVNAPTYESGYEALFDTGGWMTWKEPEYPIFEPAAGVRRLLDVSADAKALVLVLQQCEPADRAAKPVYARAASGGTHWYYHCNRPDEILAAIGGYRVVPRTKASGVLITDKPMLAPDAELTGDETVEVVPISAAEAQWFKQLWVHRLTPSPAAMNFAVVIDGAVAAVGGFSLSPTENPHGTTGPDTWSDKKILLMYCFGAYHPVYRRLNRLVCRLAKNTKAHEVFMRAGGQHLWWGALDGVITVEYSPHPESKGLRGIMKLMDRESHPDGYRLLYGTPLVTEPITDTYRAWLDKEHAAWEQKRAS